MTPETTNLLQNLGGVALLISSVGALVSSFRTNRKMKKSVEEKKREAADAAQIIVNAAADQVDVIRREAERATCKLQREREESDRWKNECEMLSGKVADLTKRVTENEDCQSRLIKKLEALENEKKSLTNRIVELEAKIEELQVENKRLKEERENEKAVVA